MNALVQRLAVGEPQRPSALQLRLSAKGLLAGVRQAFTHHGETAVRRQGLQQLPAAAAPAAQGALHPDAPGAAPSAPCVPAGHDCPGNVTSRARRVRAGAVRHALSQRPAWTMERIELREANDVFRQHQRSLGKLHGHEVAVGVARVWMAVRKRGFPAVRARFCSPEGFLLWITARGAAIVENRCRGHHC